MAEEKSITLTYYGTVYSKKNNKRIVTNRRTGKPFMVSSKQAKDMECVMTAQFSLQAREQHWGVRRADNGKIYSIAVYILNPNNAKRDLDNQLTSILDALVKAQIIPDDSNKYVKELYIQCAGTDKNPSAEVSICEYKQGEW